MTLFRRFLLLLSFPWMMNSFLMSRTSTSFGRLVLLNENNRGEEDIPIKKSFWPIRKYNHYEEYLKRLNNQTALERYLLGWEDKRDDMDLDGGDGKNKTNVHHQVTITIHPLSEWIKKSQKEIETEENEVNKDEEEEESISETLRKWNRKNLKAAENAKSEHFEVIQNCNTRFADIGGYENVKQELNQCIDILLNYSKYANYNVRIPKGLILEGPPGNGKTLLAKGFAGETQTAFISVSGAQFQDKYVGVGSSRVRELFELARKNIPCIVFIDEMDALGRKRSGDGEASTSERDNTLNELLIALDGFKTTSGIFLIGATNRADMLDPALLRPGRIDKRIFIGPPDAKTRRAILEIHLKGKPHDEATIRIDDLVDTTVGFSGAQIENMLNEAMLYALRNDRRKMEYGDIDITINKMLMGWQPNEHLYSEEILDRIAIHEMGHAIVGFFSKNHAKVSKVSINLSSPTIPGFTLFEGSTVQIHTKEYLFEHLMILLAGRIAEEEFFNMSTTTGASADFEQAFQLANRMIRDYGMGRKNVIYPSQSEYYKEMIDDEVLHIINHAYNMAKQLIKDNRYCIQKAAEYLKQERVIKIDRLTQIMFECALVDSYPLVP